MKFIFFISMLISLNTFSQSARNVDDSISGLIRLNNKRIKSSFDTTIEVRLSGSHGELASKYVKVRIYFDEYKSVLKAEKMNEINNIYSYFYFSKADIIAIQQGNNATREGTEQTFPKGLSKGDVHMLIITDPPLLPFALMDLVKNMKVKGWR